MTIRTCSSKRLYENEKRLVAKTERIANLRELAEQLWPIGSKMSVYYNPNNPKRCYVDRPVLGSTISAVFIVTGLIILALSVLLFVLIHYKFEVLEVSHEIYRHNSSRIYYLICFRYNAKKKS